MPRSARRRATGFAAAIAVVAALLSPFVVVSAASAANITGVTGGSAAGSWQDTTLEGTFTVGSSYYSSVQLPDGWNGYGLNYWLLPPGLSASINTSDGTIYVSGTPTTASASFDIEIRATASDAPYFAIDFDGVVVAAAPTVTPTTTSVAAADFQHYGTVTATAQVSTNTSGGTVQFRLGSTNIGTGVAVGGTGQAVFSGAVPTSLIGTSSTLYATFSGTSTHGNSSGTSADPVFIYGDRVISGLVTRNDLPVSSTAVQLLTTAGAATGYSTVDTGSGFSFTLASPTTLAEAAAEYVLYAPSLGLYYTESGPSATTLAGATVLNQSNWGGSKNIGETVDPTWTDETLAQPRLGQSYSDSVSAVTTGETTTITYSLSGDPLPSWLTFANGAFTATNPTDQLAYTFTVTATSSYGSISKEFDLQAGIAVITPLFTDTTIAELTVGTPLNDSITAVGDGTITYSSNTLPPGVLLNAATGALTGTPTTTGDYSVTFTASNGTEPDDTFLWEPTIAAAADLELVLDFAAGASLSVTETQIGASGLQVDSTYTLYMNSTPRLLYTGIVGASGAFLHTLSLPADTPVGSHELVLTGVAPDGTVMTARAWFTLLANGRIGAISYSGAIPFPVTAAAALAATGSDPLLPIGLAGGLMLAGFVLMMRRRSEQA